VTREDSSEPVFRLQIDALDDSRSYRVSFADDIRVLTMTGAQMRRDGVDVALPQRRSAEVVSIDPLP